MRLGCSVIKSVFFYFSGEISYEYIPVNKCLTCFQSFHIALLPISMTFCCCVRVSCGTVYKRLSNFTWYIKNHLGLVLYSIIDLKSAPALIVDDEHFFV